MDSNTIMLTVIILTYNHEDSLARALDSVLDQETSYPYQIWLCDDCSTDNTLAIGVDYAKRFPDKIKIFAQPVNTYSNPFKVFHLETAIKNVETKYFCYLDGDDTWCDNHKIQIALDILESHPEYVTFAHDTLYDNWVNNTKKSLVHEIHKEEIKNPVLLENAPYLHASSRIHRNVVKFSRNTKIRGDIYLFYIYLDQGPLYFYDKIMSVYNITGTGMWSGLSTAVREREKIIRIYSYRLNKHLNYKYDEYFTRRVGNPKKLTFLKKILSKRIGWEIWFFLTSVENVFSNLKTKYLAIRGVLT